MLSVEEWQAIGIVFGSISAVCAALIGLAAVAKLAVKGARRMFQVFKQAGEFFKQVNGDKDENRPSMMELLQETRATSQDNQKRLARIEKGLAEHVEHGHPHGHVNGPTPEPFQRGRRR